MRVSRTLYAVIALSVAALFVSSAAEARRRHMPIFGHIAQNVGVVNSSSVVGLATCPGDSCQGTLYPEDWTPALPTQWVAFSGWADVEESTVFAQVDGVSAPSGVAVAECDGCYTEWLDKGQEYQIP